MLPPELLLDSLSGKSLPFSVRALSALPAELIKLGEASIRKNFASGWYAGLIAPREEGVLLTLLRCPGLSRLIQNQALVARVLCGEVEYTHTRFVSYEDSTIDGDWCAVAILLPIPPRQSCRVELSSNWPARASTIEFWGGKLPADFWAERAP